MLVKIERMDTTGEGPVVVGVADLLDTGMQPEEIGAQFALTLNAEERDWNEVWLLDEDGNPIAKAVCTR
jgi:hypothetical protein